MKLLSAVLLLLVVLSNAVQAADRIYTCDIKDGRNFALDRDPEKDEWTLTISKEGKHQTSVYKDGNEMAVGTLYSRTENTATVELYVNALQGMYVLASSEHGTKVTGYVYLSVNGKQTAYGECEIKTLQVDFSKQGLFDNFTIVD